MVVEETNPLTAGGPDHRGPLDNSFAVVCIGPLWPFINAPWPLITARGRLLIRRPCWSGKMRIGSPSTTRTALRRTRYAAGAASPSPSATTGGVGRSQPLRKRLLGNMAVPRSSTRVSVVNATKAPASVSPPSELVSVSSVQVSTSLPSTPTLRNQLPFIGMRNCRFNS